MSELPVRQFRDRAFARELRRQQLTLIWKRVKPGTGSSWQSLMRREWSPLSVDLSKLNLPFVIVGAVATRLYMPQRETRDIDILVLERDASRVESALLAAGFKKTALLSIGGSHWEDERENEIDVLISGESWVEQALAAPRRSPDGLPVIDLPFLVLMKFNASRGQDLGDLERMLGLSSEPERDRVRQAFEQYQPEDLEDLESMIKLGEILYGGVRTRDDPD